ncbi:MAG: tetratricopeptide repeat protein [Pseudomonadota bacterium]
MSTVVLLAGCFASLPAWALDDDKAKAEAERAMRSVEAGLARRAPPPGSALREPTVAERIAAGEMLVRLGDADRAVGELSHVIELHRQGKASEAAFADASHLIAEAYFKLDQLLSAERHYREVLAHASRPSFQVYAGRAGSRLVDIAVRRGDLASIEEISTALARLPVDRSGSIPYARAKAYLAQRDFLAGERELATVPQGSDYAHQSQYLLGVLLLRKAALEPASGASVEPSAEAAPEGEAAPEPASEPSPGELARRYKPAIEQFRRVTRMPYKTEAERHVIDLAWMAIGRLSYEASDYLSAAQAYTNVGRTSPEFATMLYELAWVYVRLGEYQRAQRALEVLSVLDPQNMEAADGSLLRADLMLRSGQFAKALALYRSVHAKFDPIREKVEAFLASTNDPASYYDRLTTDTRLELEGALPPVVLRWAREETEDEHVFGMIEDMNLSRELVREGRRMAARLSAVLLVPTRIKAFPEMRARVQYALELMNRASTARRLLAEGLDDVVDDDDVGGELLAIRRARRALMDSMRALPTSEEQFLRRDEVGEKQWNRVSQTLQALLLEVDRLNAIVNGLRRVLAQPEAYGVTTDAASLKRFEDEVAANERELAEHRRLIAEYREAVALGRAQTGFGDQRYVADDDTRKRFRELFDREVALVATGQAGRSGARYAREIGPLLQRIKSAEARLEEQLDTYDVQVRALAAELERKVNAEVAELERRAQELEAVEGEARTAIGEVAQHSFGLVRDRLKSVVLRADVGIVQEAWEVREEQRVRVRNLLRERSREEQNLNDELREVLEDAEDDR